MDFETIENCRTIGELKQQKRNLLCYIRWAKRALDKHIRTYQPIIVRDSSGVATVWDFLELERDMRSANLELYCVKRKILQQKRRTKS